MATNPIVHELSGCSVVIRPDPTPLPYLPGATVTGHIALVARNEEGVRDVKHRLQVAALTLRYNWEARQSPPPPPCCCSLARSPISQATLRRRGRALDETTDR